MVRNLFFKSKKANLLTENVIFIVLNLVFLAILVVFILRASNDASILEEKYAKQIALMLDTAKPGMEIGIELSDAIKKAEKEEWPVEKIVSVSGNLVSVKLSEDGGYSYSFFNDIEPSIDIGPNEIYILVREKNG